MSVKNKIVNYLAKNRTLTVNQARAMFGVNNVTARIHELRSEGYTIYSNRKVKRNGNRVTTYRLGIPSERYLANLDAGRTRLAIANLYGVK